MRASVHTGDALKPRDFLSVTDWKVRAELMQSDTLPYAEIRQLQPNRNNSQLTCAQPNRSGGWKSPPGECCEISSAGGKKSVVSMHGSALATYPDEGWNRSKAGNCTTGT